MTVTELKFKKKIHEMLMVEPADWGIDLINNIYYKVTRQFKRWPLIKIVPLSLVSAFLIYFVLGSLLIKLVSLLQYGF